MKPIYLIILPLFLLISCNNKKDIKEMELKLKELELQQKENELKELEQKQNTPETETKPTTEVVEYESVSGKNYGKISGSNVIMRNSHSTSAKNIGNFKNGERVEILDEYKPSNNDEAITKNPIKLYNSNNDLVYTLPRGKAVQVIEELSNDQYEVSFVHKEHGTLTTTIGIEDLEFISGDKWYKVKQTNGKEGWVFSKFLNY